MENVTSLLKDFLPSQHGIGEKKKKKERFCPFRVEKAPALLTPSPESGPEAPRGFTDGQVASLPPQTEGGPKGEKCPRPKMNSA